MRLTTDDHDRGAGGRRHVYPVFSRRSGGLSIGINLNPDKSCNWRCIYCQVPDLVRGAPPAVDLELLEHELSSILTEIRRGDFLERHLPPAARRLNDIAFSGDGESTLCPNFEQAVVRVRHVMAAQGLGVSTPLVLITNGSQVLRAGVSRGLAEIASAGGELWFKIDRAGPQARRRINDTRGEDGALLERLEHAARLCPTRIQTCLFAVDGAPPCEPELREYLNLLASARERGIELRDVLLYGLAREVRQPEAERLSRLPASWLENFAERIRALDLRVEVHP